MKKMEKKKSGDRDCEDLSEEEFQEKQTRGRAAGRTREVKTEYFDRFDLNDIKDI